MNPCRQHLCATRPGRLTVLCITVMTALLVLSGCRFDPATIRLPGQSSDSETYSLRIQFDNTLNLQDGATVYADGVKVGYLTKVELRRNTDRAPTPPRTEGAPTDSNTETTSTGGYVLATVAIDREAVIPIGTTAVLRQATPLGDMHIALSTPPDAGVALQANALIPIADTSPSPQIEDVMAQLAATINAGALTDLQEIVRQLDSALPADPEETARTFGVIGQNFQDIAKNIDSTDAALAGMTDFVGMLTANTAQLDGMLADEGVPHVVSVFDSVLQVIAMMTDFGPLSRNAIWLAPTLRGVDELVHSALPMLYTGNPINLSQPSTAERFLDLLRTKIIPFAEAGPRVEITELSIADSPAPPTEQEQGIIDALRLVGVLR